MRDFCVKKIRSFLYRSFAKACESEIQKFDLKYLRKYIKIIFDIFKKGMMMKILISGGAGYIGSHTLRQFLKQIMNCVLDNLSKGSKIAIEDLQK